MTKISRLNEKGIALMLALVSLVVFSIIGVGIVTISRHETGFVVQERLSEDALYIADGGVEFAVSQLKGNPNYRGPTSSGLGVGTYTVNVATAGVNQYAITSVAHIPNQANSRATRSVETVVQRTPYQATEAARTEGGVWVFDPTTIKGTIHANGYLWFDENTTVTPDDNNNGSVYTSAHQSWLDIWLPGRDEAIYITEGKTLTMDSSQEVRSNSRIKTEDRIVGTTNIEEWSNVPGLTFPSVDDTQLLAGAVDMGTGQPPDPFIMEDGKVYNFRRDGFLGTLNFGVVQGEGTIVASQGVRVNFNQPIGSADNYAEMNVVLLDAGWFDKVEFKQDTYIEGFISSEGFVKATGNIFRMRGTVEAYRNNSIWYSLLIEAGATLEWKELQNPPPGFMSGGAISVVSWEELSGT